MATREWWNNCAIGEEADSEILAVDRLEDQIAPIAANVSKIRKLIGSLEMCHYKEHEEFWRQTVETTPFEGLQGLDGEDFSLGLAIDLLWTCHWKFVDNLQIVLEVIGGNLKPERPLAACAWNVTLSPIRPRMKVVSNSLKVFCGDSELDKEIDRDVLSLLGEPTEEKKWLAASLDKTIRLQLGL